MVLDVYDEPQLYFKHTMTHNDSIRVSGLTKRYKELTAVDNLSFTVKEGEMVGLLGPNGSGKTTTINCILSLLSYDSGKITVLGKPMSADATGIKAQIGVVFQDVAVFDELSVYENIDYFCGLYIRDKTTRARYVQDAINLVGLDDFKKFRPKKLSGGLLRRLNIACGIAHKPKLLFFDEPTVAVDPQSRNNILEGIRTLNKQGATVVYTTHYMEEVEILCDRILILDKGKLIAEGTSEALKRSVSRGENVIVAVPKLTHEQITAISALPNVIEATYKEEELTVHYDRTAQKGLVTLIGFLDKMKILYTDIHSVQPTLNDVFLELTGKKLRD